MILAWDMKTMSTPYIYSRHYANITKPSLLTGQARCIAALPSMPGYVQQAVNKFQYGITSTNKATDAPHPYKATKKHGLPMTHPTDNSTKLSPQAIKHLQQIVGTFLF